MKKINHIMCLCSHHRKCLSELCSHYPPHHEHDACTSTGYNCPFVPGVAFVSVRCEKKEVRSTERNRTVSKRKED